MYIAYLRHVSRTTGRKSRAIEGEKDERVVRGRGVLRGRVRDWYEARRGAKKRILRMDTAAAANKEDVL